MQSTSELFSAESAEHKQAAHKRSITGILVLVLILALLWGWVSKVKSDGRIQSDQIKAARELTRIEAERRQRQRCISLDHADQSVIEGNTCVGFDNSITATESKGTIIRNNAIR